MIGSRLVYPALHGRLDLGFARLNGAGLGNCLFTYCHAVAIARQNDARLIAPAWRTVALSAQLRGRQFGDLVGPHPDELAGGRKALVLAGRFWRAARFHATAADAPSLHAGLTVISAPYVFDGLHRDREALRARILDTIRAPRRPAWGAERYAAMHVRLGDFAVADETLLDTGEHANLRIPIGWYVGVAARLRQALPALPITIFSNGSDDDLGPLLALDGVSRHPSASDVDDLLAMAGARLLVGSHSTFSQWAAFLGNMPTLWRDRQTRSERPTDAATPLFHVDRHLAGFPDPGTLAAIA